MLLFINFRTARKVAGYLGEVLEEQRDKLQENLLANNSKTSLVNVVSQYGLTVQNNDCILHEK